MGNPSPLRLRSRLRHRTARRTGNIHGIIVDTAYFKGNYPPFVSIEAASIEGYPSVEEIMKVDWQTIVEKSPAEVTPPMENTNPDARSGSLSDALVGADVFIGVSAPNILTGNDIAAMAANSVVFALANPIPEVDPLVAGEHAAVVATGRSDFPNQINNVLAFPGVFRGLLDAHAVDITDDMLIAAARAISDSVSPSELNPTYIVPSVFDAAVAPAVAAAVREAAGKGGESDV